MASRDGRGAGERLDLPIHVIAYPTRRKDAQDCFNLQLDVRIPIAQLAQALALRESEKQPLATRAEDWLGQTAHSKSCWADVGEESDDCNPPAAPSRPGAAGQSWEDQPWNDQPWNGNAMLGKGGWTDLGDAPKDRQLHAAASRPGTVRQSWNDQPWDDQSWNETAEALNLKPFDPPYGLGTPEAANMEWEVIEHLRTNGATPIGSLRNVSDIGKRWNQLFWQKERVNNGTWKTWLATLPGVKLDLSVDPYPGVVYFDPDAMWEVNGKGWGKGSYSQAQDQFDPQDMLTHEQVDAITDYLRRSGGELDGGKLGSQFPGVKRWQLENHFQVACRHAGQYTVRLVGGRRGRGKP